MIYIGTSGYSYKDWEGTFYPKGLKPGGYLEFYSREFPTVEINSSYYRIPSPYMLRRMCEKPRHRFLFTIKACRELTHELSDKWEPLAEQFETALRELRSKDSLGAILFQFPYSFHKTEHNIRYLDQLLNFFHDYPKVVEFRNVCWTDSKIYPFLKERDTGFCCVDEPRLKGLIPPLSIATSAIGYLRFHGRNAKRWWQHDEAWERYDYLYERRELEEWIPGIQKLARETEKLFIFNNNHPRGQAVLNARTMKDVLGTVLDDEIVTVPDSGRGPLTLDL
jgi:uncharacterized protein YecE (DUF72 family)